MTRSNRWLQETNSSRKSLQSSKESSRLSTKLGLQSYHCCRATFLGWNPILEHTAHIIQNLEITQLFWGFFKFNQISLGRPCTTQLFSPRVGRSSLCNMALTQPSEIRCLERGQDSFISENQNKAQNTQSHSKQVQLRTFELRQCQNHTFNFWRRATFRMSTNRTSHKPCNTCCLAKVQNNHVRSVVGMGDWIWLTKLSYQNASPTLSSEEKVQIFCNMFTPTVWASISSHSMLLLS